MPLLPASGATPARSGLLCCAASACRLPRLPARSFTACVSAAPFHTACLTDLTYVSAAVLRSAAMQTPPHAFVLRHLPLPSATSTFLPLPALRCVSTSLPCLFLTHLSHRYLLLPLPALQVALFYLFRFVTSPVYGSRSAVSRSGAYHHLTIGLLPPPGGALPASLMHYSHTCHTAVLWFCASPACHILSSFIDLVLPPLYPPVPLLSPTCRLLHSFVLPCTSSAALSFAFLRLHGSCCLLPHTSKSLRFYLHLIQLRSLHATTAASPPCCLPHLDITFTLPRS